jgi:hypothetical protein
MALEEIVKVARTEVDKKVREVGSNRGAEVEKYQKSVGLSPGSPWCAAFVGWCVMVGLDRTKPPAWCSGSAVTGWQRAVTKLKGSDSIALPHERHKVKAGWVWARCSTIEEVAAVRKGKWTKGHTGIVAQPAEAHFDTLEGNTNGAGSREGDGAYAKKQSWTDPRTLGWFDPVALTAAYEAKA